MKKLLVLVVAIMFASCSKDEVQTTTPEATVASVSVLDGGMLSYKDDKSFVAEYSKVAELKTTKEVQNWIAKKGHQSLLNAFDPAAGIYDSITSPKHIFYSDALKAVLNADAKVKINGKVIWLSNRNFYALDEANVTASTQKLTGSKNNLKLYGSVAGTVTTKNSKNPTGKLILNGGGFGTAPGFDYVAVDQKRYNMTLFNESMHVGNNNQVSSKLYLASSFWYKSCSFWRCTYKEEFTTTREIVLNIQFPTSGINSGGSTVYQNWVGVGLNNPFYITGNKTTLIATTPNDLPPPFAPNPIITTGFCDITGTVTTSRAKNNNNNYPWGNYPWTLNL
jgi:hypothetical protein